MWPGWELGLGGGVGEGVGEGEGEGEREGRGGAVREFRYCI